MIVATVTIRASKDVEPIPGETRSEMALDELRILAEELQRFASVAGWTLEVQSAVESRCVFERAMHWHSDAAPQMEQCPETATEVVGGSEFCAAHAKGARRLMDAVRRAS